MPEDQPSLTHRFSTAVDLLTTFERLGTEAPTVDETRAFVVYRETVLDLDVTEGQLTDAAVIAVEVWDPEDLPAETEPADHLSNFVTAIENARPN